MPSIGTTLQGKFGTTASSAIKNELDSRNCRDNVFGMVFDTTNSNSGACVVL